MPSFDFRALYKRSQIPQPCLSYDQLVEEGLEYYIREQFDEIDFDLLPEMHFDEVEEEKIIESENKLFYPGIREEVKLNWIKITRMEGVDPKEARNAFLTRVCRMIGVDPSEAIARDFRYYSDMVDWLRHTYHDHVIDLYEAKLERYYQMICETLYARCTDYETQPSSDRPQREIAKKVQHIFRTIINSAAWWDSNIVWILDLLDENVSATLATNTWFPEEIDDEMDRIFLDEAIEPQVEA